MIIIDQELCTTCGICGHVCPRHIMETLDRDGEKITVVSEERADLCMECGHCEAVCPEGAVHVEAFEGREFRPLEGIAIKDHELLTLMKERRSVRRYKDKPVPRELLDRIIDAAHTAPNGTGRSTTGVIVIDNPETLSAFSELAYKLYEGLEKVLKNPIGRFIIRRRVGEQTLNTLKDFVMPGMHWYIRWYREGRSNEILRDCPALMLFHSPIREPMASENSLIAAFHCIFMAQVLGIGTCFNDLIPPICNRSQEIRDLLGLSADREVYSSLTLGYPKYKFTRSIPRQLAEVKFL